MKQKLLDFVTRRPKLGTRTLEGYYKVFLSVQTRVPDPDEEYGGGFGVDYIYKTHSKRLCVIARSEGEHVVCEAIRRYSETYSKDHETVKQIANGDEIVSVNVTHTYPEDELEVFEIHLEIGSVLIAG